MVTRSRSYLRGIPRRSPRRCAVSITSCPGGIPAPAIPAVDHDRSWRMRHRWSAAGAGPQYALQGVCWKGLMIGGLNNRGFTLVELMFGLIIAAALVAIAAPALQVAMGRNSVEAEAQRLMNDIYFARSEAVKRGVYVNLCRSDAASCDVENPASCRCLSGVPAKRYDWGWLIYVARDPKKNFDPKKGDTLLRVGDPAYTGIVMRTNNAVQDRMGFNRAGGLGKAAGGLVAVCQDAVSTEEVPGRLISLSATGRARIDRMAPGQDCLTDQGQGQGG